MQEDTRRLQDDTDAWVLKYESLKRFAIDQKISIPPELEHI